MVEKWIPRTAIRKDLYGFIDILAIRSGEVKAIQATSYSNVPSRVTKIRASPALDEVLACRWQIEVWGWRKKGRFWVPRVVEVTGGEAELAE